MNQTVIVGALSAHYALRDLDDYPAFQAPSLNNPKRVIAVRDGASGRLYLSPASQERGRAVFERYDGFSSEAAQAGIASAEEANQKLLREIVPAGQREDLRRWALGLYRIADRAMTTELSDGERRHTARLAALQATLIDLIERLEQSRQATAATIELPALAGLDDSLSVGSAYSIEYADGSLLALQIGDDRVALTRTDSSGRTSAVRSEALKRIPISLEDDWRAWLRRTRDQAHTHFEALEVDDDDPPAVRLRALASGRAEIAKRIATLNGLLAR